MSVEQNTICSYYTFSIYLYQILLLDKYNQWKFYDIEISFVLVLFECLVSTFLKWYYLCLMPKMDQGHSMEEVIFLPFINILKFELQMCFVSIDILLVINKWLNNLP